MFSFPDRGDERLRYEISRDEECGGYLLVVTAPDGRQFTRRVESPTDLIEQSLAELEQFRAEGWRVG